MVSDWTRAPIEDGVDGTGVYASRLRSRRSARGPQSPKVLVPGGVHVRSDIKNWGGIYTASITFFWLFVGLVVIMMRLLVIDWCAGCQARVLMVRSRSLFISGC